MNREIFDAVQIYLDRMNVATTMTGVVLSSNQKTATVRLIGSNVVNTYKTFRGISPQPGDIAVLLRLNSTTWVVIGSYEG
jgi:hypothetical protein